MIADGPRRPQRLRELMLGQTLEVSVADLPPGRTLQREAQMWRMTSYEAGIPVTIHVDREASRVVVRRLAGVVV